MVNNATGGACARARVRVLCCSSTRRNPIFGALPAAAAVTVRLVGKAGGRGGVPGSGPTAVLDERETV